MTSRIYRLKRALCHPHFLVQRYRFRKLDDAGRAILEAHGYSRHILNFAGYYASSDPLHSFSLDRESVVIDMGGYDGSWAWEIHERYQPRMYIYEPWRGGIRKMRSRFADAPRVKLRPFAVSNVNGKAALQVEGPGSFLRSDNPPRSATQTAVEIELRDVAELFDELPPEIDLLKINIEGSEYPVLERMLEKDLVGRCRILLVQFHEWEPGAYFRRWQITRALRKTHRRVWNFPFVWECWERL